MLPTATRTLIRAEVKTNDLHDNSNLHRFVVPALRDERIGRVFINRSTRDRSDLRPKCAASGAPSLRDTTATPPALPRPSPHRRGRTSERALK